jgi:hypothetical protein
MSQCGWYAVPQQSISHRRYWVPRGLRKDQVLAVAYWGCPLCHTPAGDECYGEGMHAERADAARRQWWGPMYDEMMMASRVNG